MVKFLSSYLTLYFVALISIVAISIHHTLQGYETLGIAKLFQSCFLQLLLGLWVRKDSAKIGAPFPADFAMLSNFCFPLYLIHSRGWEGLGLTILFWALTALILIPSVVVSWKMVFN